MLRKFHRKLPRNVVVLRVKNRKVKFDVLVDLNKLQNHFQHCLLDLQPNNGIRIFELCQTHVKRR